MALMARRELLLFDAARRRERREVDGTICCTLASSIVFNARHSTIFVPHAPQGFVVDRDVTS